MKSLFRSKIVASLLALGLLLAPSLGFAQAYRYWWQVVDEMGRPYQGQTVRCSVYRIGTGTALAYHFSSNLANPGSTMPLLSDANSMLHFWSSANTDVGVICNSVSGGQAGARLRYTDHSIVIDRQGRKVVRFQVVQNATAVNTNVFIPGGAIIRDVMVQQVTGAANAHLEVGFRGDHLGAHNLSALVHRLALPAANDATFVRPGATFDADGGTYPVVAAVHRGSALATYHLVATSVKFQGGSYQPGFYVETAYSVPAVGVELAYRTSNTAGLSAHVFVLFDLFHVGSMGSDYRF